jgi:hypothetical protein
VKVKGRSAVGHDTDMTGHLGGTALEIEEGPPEKTAKLKDNAESRIAVLVINRGLIIIMSVANQVAHNAPVQRARAISIQPSSQEAILRTMLSRAPLQQVVRMPALARLFLIWHNHLAILKIKDDAARYLHGFSCQFRGLETSADCCSNRVGP